MKELTHTVTGTDAAAAKILEEVYAIFDKKSTKATNYEGWRLEFHIIQVMTSPMNISWEPRKSDILKMVNACCHNAAEHKTKAEINTAFRRLTCRGFLYGSYTKQNWTSPKERTYGLNLSRYDTEEVAA
jgi:hypothetical protein